MSFASPFDAALADQGPAAVFLPDREGLLRFEAEWTRDCWERVPEADRGALGGPPRWTWVLVRDRASGFVNLVLVTHPTLLAVHPRADLRAFATRDEAESALRAFGRPPLASAPW